MRFSKAQASLEYMILLGLFLTMLGIIVFFSSSQVTDYIKNNELGDSAKTVSAVVNQVAAMGPGATKTIQIKMPEGVTQGYGTYKEVMFKSQTYNIPSDIHFATKVPVYGLLEPGSGRRFIIVRVQDNGYVSLDMLGSPNITQSLIAYYHFENKNASHTREATGQAEAGEILGGADCSEDAYIGRGCVLGSQGSYILASGNDALNQMDKMTLSVWVRFNQSNTASRQSLITKWADTGEKSWRLQRNNPGTNTKISFVTMSQSGSSDTLETSREFLNKRWYHVVASYNGSFKAIYIDGIKDSSASYTGGINNTLTPINIGARNQNTDWLNGTIDEVMIWERALTDFEVDRLYKLGRSPQ